MLVKACLLFSKLFEEVSELRKNKFSIYFHWKPLDLTKYATLTLRQIVEEDPTQETPVFYISNLVDPSDVSKLSKKYGYAVAQHQKTS